MAKTQPTSSFTIRCPSDLMKGIDEQVEQTRQNKTDVIVGMLLSSIPSVQITERVKLPSLPGIYFVYTLDHQLLYIGKADNLRNRWNSHHKYQYFIESSMDSRIGYFTFDSIDNLNQTIEEFQSEPTETIQNKALVTSDQFEKLQKELATLKKQFNDTLSVLVQLGSDKVVKKLQNYLPKRGLQEWNPSSEDLREGITRSSLAKYFGFHTVSDLEQTASLLEIDPIDYLEELSGWKYQPAGEGNPSPKFFNS